MQENPINNDPLGILGKEDPLGILKKKDGGAKLPISSSQYASPLRKEELPLGIPQQKRSVSQEALTAKEKINKSISESDDILTRLIRENRVSAFETQQQATPQLDGFINPAAQSAKRFLITQSAVTPDEVIAKKQEAMSDDKTAREVLKRVAKKDPTIASSAYIVDAQQRAVPEKENQILANADKIANGELTYNISKGILQQPQGVIESGIRGFKERSRQLEDYDKIVNAINPQDKIKILEEGFASYDPDKPVPVPQGASAQFAEMFGMEGIPMLKGAAAATITGLIPGAQTAAPLVAAFAASPEYYKRSYESGIRSAYYELRQRGKTPEEALAVAEDQAQKEGIIGAAEGAVSSALGARIGFKPSSIVSSPVMKGAIGKAVSASANVVRQMAPEAAADAGAAGLLQIASNLTARDNGLNRGVFDGVQENIAGEVGFTIGMGILTKGGRRFVDPNTYRTILNGFSRQPKDVTDSKLGEMIVTGAITPEDAVDVSRLIERERGLDAQIPKTIPETVRPQITEMIEKRDELKQQLASANEAFHPNIKEEIKSIDQQILGYANGQVEEGQVAQPQDNAIDSKGEGTIITLAPFYNTTVSNTSDAKKIRETPEYKQYIESIPTVAKALGLGVEIVNETIGGFVNSAGEKITEVSNKIFVANGTIDQAEEFGAIMGTMTPETQEATIAARYINEQEKDSVPADEYVEEIGIVVGDIDGALESLREAGIFDFTVDESKNTVSILDFSRGEDVAFDNNIANFVLSLKEKNISYGKEGRRPVNSRYIGPSRRTEILERIAGDAVRLQQGGEDLRSIITEARRRNQKFGEEEVARQGRSSQLETELKQDLVSDPISKAEQTLKSTGVSIELVEDPAEYDTMVEQLGGQRGTEGVFLSNEGKILLNKSKLNDAITAGRIVWHESSHPIVNIIRNTNPELYNRVIYGMKSSDNPAVQQAIAWANQNYQGEGVIDDESIVEAIAMVADGTLDLNQVPTGLKQSIIDFINLIARAFNLGQISNTDVQEFKNLAGQIADALTSGRDIAEVVGRENVTQTQFNSTQARANEVFDGILDKIGIPIGTVNKKTGNKKVTNFDVAKAMNEYYKKVFKTLRIDDFGKKALESVSDHATDEVVFGIQKFGDNSGKGWYTADYSKALEIMKSFDPDIVNRPDVKEVATVVIAISSNSTDVYTNLTRVIYAIDKFKTTGKIPTDIGTGKGASAIASSVEVYNKLLEVFGSVDSLKEFMQTVRPVSESKKALIEKAGLKSWAQVKNAGLGTDPDWNDNEVLPTSVILFGPKIGAFYSNLSGLGGTPTIDRWCIRTMYRYRGDMKAKALPSELNDFIKANKLEGQSKGSVMSIIQDHAKMFNAILTGRGEYKGQTKEQRNERLKPYRKGSQIWAKMSGVVNEIEDGLTEKIENKAEYARNFRSFTKKSFERVQEKVKERVGEDLAISDIQAVLWIYEKELFGALGVKQKPESTYSASAQRLLNEIASGKFTLEQMKAGKVTGDPDVTEEGSMGDSYGLSVDSFEDGINKQPSRLRESVLQSSVGNRLAPNGQPSKLNEGQYAQVRTPEFKNWFGDWENDPKNASRVVDENGEPLIVYHFTPAKFDTFEKRGLSKGFFFTTQAKDPEFNYEGRVIKAFLNIKKLSQLSEMPEEEWSVPYYENQWIDRSKSDGNDGIRFIKEGDEKTVYVAFSPNQIKSATKNSGEFSTEDNRMQASVGNREIINGFYSPIEDRINTFKQPKASVQKWKEIVGVKSDEAVYSGLADWLGGMKPDRQLSKEEVSQFIKDNRIEINEVVKGKGGKMSQSQMDDVYNGVRDQLSNMDMIEDVDDNPNNPLDVWYKNPTDDNYEALGEFAEERGIDLNFIAENDDTKFSQYQLPGGENYKEVLITLPGKDQFQSSHFDETNIVTHLRMNTRTDADGKKVLFLEEVQSDWGQKGKREGFSGELQKKNDEIIKKSGIEYEEKGGVVYFYKDGKKIDYDDVPENVRNAIGDTVNGWMGIPSAPYVTNTNAWVKLGLKVALKEAVKQGADRIAWTTGDQQNDRYDLSKRVDEIGYSYNPRSNSYRIVAGKDGDQRYNSELKESELEGSFGKDVADKIVSNKESSVGKMNFLRGQDLKVGGKGMKAFYGDAQTPGIVGNVAKALIKELTGKEGGIVPSKLSSERNQDVIDRYNRARQYGNIPEALAKEYEQSQGLNSEQPAIDITPELSYAVTGGMPQFSVGNRPENNANFKLGAFVMRKKAEGATDGEIAIAIASVTGMKPEDIKTLIDNPEQYIRDKFPSMSKLQQDNLIEKAKIQNIYRGRQFGKPIDKAFTGLEVPQEYVDEYMQRTASADNFVKQWAKDFQKNWLDPAKGLPNWVLEIKDFASGSKNIEIARASKTIERLKDEAKKIGFTDWDAFGKALVVAKDVKRYIPNADGVLPFDAYRAEAGRMFTTPDDQLPALVPDEIKSLPDEIIPYVYAMRGQIDNLTRDLIGDGYVTPEQAVTLENNIGAYVNRSYRMFNEMRYKPEPEVMNTAIKFLADNHVKKLATDKVGAVPDKQIYDEAVEMAKKDVSDILNKKKNPYFNTSIDRRNTGILQDRKDVPEPLRKLMGEYTDPGTVFMMTVAKQAALKASSQYLNKLRENGMGTLFFEKDDPSRPLSHSVQIAAAGSESMNPLGGLYTTPEIAEAIETVEPTYNELTNTWMKLVGAVRWGKTVGSVTTQLKNIESNLGFAVLNGMLLSGKNTKAYGAALKYMKGQYSPKEIDAITDKVIRLNLVGQSVGMRELKDMLGSGDVHDIALDIALSPEGKWGKKVAKKLNVFGQANKFYRLGDDFWKVYAYINEREQLSDARFNGSKYDELTKEQQDQIDLESSERVKSTWPTYDRVVKAASYLSKNAPIFGNFISFQAESLRVLANSIKIAKQDMADPQLRHLGVRRAAGIAAYFGLRSAITIGVAKLTGFAAAGILGAAFGDDEEERNKKAMQEALPTHMRTGEFFVKRTKDPHKFIVVNASSLDPYGIIPNSLNAFTEGREGVFGKTMEPGVAAATLELFSAFLEPEMTFSAMWSVKNNIDPKTKKSIVVESDTNAQAFAKVVGKVWDQLEPSTVSLVERLIERENKGAELLAIVGARPYDVDLHKSFGYILSDFGREVESINTEYNKIKFKEGMSQQDKDAAEKVAEDNKAFAISRINEIYRNFINIGADPKVLNDLINQRSAIKVTGFDPKTKTSIKTGKIQKENLFK